MFLNHNFLKFHAFWWNTFNITYLFRLNRRVYILRYIKYLKDTYILKHDWFRENQYRKHFLLKSIPFVREQEFNRIGIDLVGKEEKNCKYLNRKSKWSYYLIRHFYIQNLCNQFYCVVYTFLLHYLLNKFFPKPGNPKIMFRCTIYASMTQQKALWRSGLN